MDLEKLTEELEALTTRAHEAGLTEEQIVTALSDEIAGFENDRDPQ